MLLAENIVIRYHEWRDRKQEPDLVPRMRRLWSVDRIESAPPPRCRRKLLVHRHRAALGVSRGA